MASEADIAHWKDAEKRVAELEKENARLREALEHIAKHPSDSLLMKYISDYARAALNPPKGGAVPKGLSKEKAK